MPIIRLAQRHFVSIKMKDTLGLEDNPFDPKTVKPVCRAGQPILMDADPTLRELVCDNLAHFAECEERIRGALFDKDRPGEVARDLIFIILGVQGSGRSTLASSIHLHIHGGMPAERREWQEFLLVFETSPAGATEMEISAKFKTLRDNISSRFRSGPGKALVLIDKLPQVFVKPAKTKIAADTLCLDAFRRLPAGAVKEQHRRQPKLPREMIDDFDWRVAVVIEKSAMGAQHAKLQSKAAAMVGATALDDLGHVCRRQTPMLRKIVFARVSRHRCPRQGLRSSGQGIIRRHSGASAPGQPPNHHAMAACRWRSYRANHGRAGWQDQQVFQDYLAGSRAQMCAAGCAPKRPPA